MRVLIVDDNPQVADDLQLLLPGHIELAWVPGSCEALTHLESEALPDALILDICMPCYLGDTEETEGLALLQHVRREYGVALPVIVYSSTADDDTASQCLDLGAQAFLEKSCAIQELILQLHSVTRSRS